jgi:hypothetical protein
MPECERCDANRNDHVEVSEIVKAVAKLATATARGDERAQEAIDHSLGVGIRVGHAVAAAGDAATISVRLSSGAVAVIGTQNDLLFAPHLTIASRSNGKPDCSVSPAIDKPDSTFNFLPVGCTPGVDCTRVRSLILSLDNTSAIPNLSVLYSCRIAIAPDASGTLPIECADALASPPAGGDIAAECTEGQITLQP